MEEKEKGRLNSYFQVIGIVVLLGHTLLMGLEILWGLLLVLLGLATAIVLALLEFLTLYNLVLLALWLVLGRLSTAQLLSVELQCC